MKNTTKVAATLLLTVMMGTFGCQTNSEKVTPAKSEAAEIDTTNLNLTQEEYLLDVEKYKKETNTKISANEQSIKEFKARIASNKKDAKANYDKKINDLEQKNTDMKRKLDEYKIEGKEHWNSFKEEFNHDMDELGNALKDLTVNNTKS